MNLPSCSSKALKSTTRSVLVFHVAWIPPADFSWKLNFAGFVADHQTGTGGAAFILRDENAILKSACALPVEHAENLFAAELMALRHGLQIAVKQGVEYLEIEGDCSVVFQMLHGLIIPSSPTLNQLLGECVHYMMSFRDVKIRWVSIHSNEPTNKMAILAIGEEEPVYWFNKPPAEILDLLIEDVIGRWVPLDV